MRSAIFCLLALAACAPDDSVISGGESEDATVTTFDGDCFCAADASRPDAAVDAGPKFNGGAPFACLGCTCDGTLYGCLHDALVDGTCPKGGGPPVPDHAPIDDAAAPDADDDGGTCEAGVVCDELPVVCLPNPTCDCIAKATGLACAVDPSGDGFILTCPPPPP